MDKMTGLDNIAKVIMKLNDADISFDTTSLSNGGVFITITNPNMKHKGEITCTDRTGWRFMYGRGSEIFNARPGTYMDDIDKCINQIISICNNAEEDNCPEGTNNLLNIEALNWLKSINYAKKSHDERMILIKAAKIAYP